MLSICFVLKHFIIISIEIWANTIDKSNRPRRIKIQNDSFMHRPMFTPVNWHFVIIRVIKHWWFWSVSTKRESRKITQTAWIPPTQQLHTINIAKRRHPQHDPLTRQRRRLPHEPIHRTLILILILILLRLLILRQLIVL